MNKLRVFLLIVLMGTVGNLAFSTNLGTLAEVLKPTYIDVSRNEVFILEGATIFVYSLNNLNLLKKFGKAGEGPGELKFYPDFSNMIKVFPDHIIAVSIDKMLYYSREGKLLKEQKTSPIFRNEMIPLGENFVVKKRLQVGERRVQYTSLNIYNPKTKETKELHRQLLPYSGATRKINLIPDPIYFQVYNDKLFVEKSSEGFVIDVLNSKGEKIYVINRKYEKIPVTDMYREDAIKLQKEDANYIRMQFTWEDFKKRFNVIFPDHLPPIKDFIVTDNKIYVQTYNKQKNKQGYVIMDLKGKILKRLYLPLVKQPNFSEQMMGSGSKYFSICNNKFYYLHEDEDNEEWEVHVQNIE